MPSHIHDHIMQFSLGSMIMLRCMLLLLVAIGFMLFARVHHFFLRHCYHRSTHMHLFTLLLFDFFSTYFVRFFFSFGSSTLFNTFYSFVYFSFILLSGFCFWVFDYSLKRFNSVKCTEIIFSYWMKNKKSKLKLNRIVKSNTKNVNVITFSFTSALWIDAIAIHFPLFYSCCFSKRIYIRKYDTQTHSKAMVCMHLIF